MRVLVLAAATLLAVLGSATAQVTRGDLFDMDAAEGVHRCARQFLGKPNEGPDHEIWIMCLQAASGSENRDPMKVSKHVIRRQGSNVFDAAGAPMSPELEARIRSGL